MKLDLGKMLKMAAKAAYLVMSRAFGFAILGLVVNAIAFVVLLPEIAAWMEADGSGGPMGGHGGGGLAIVLLVLIFWKPIVACLVFFVGMPIAYFLLGQKHGVGVALRYIVGEEKRFLVDYLVKKLADKFATPAFIDRVNKSGLRATLNDVLPVYLAKLDNLPWALRKLFRLLVRRVDFRGILMGVVESKQMTTLDADTLADGLAEATNTLIDEHLLKAKLTLLWIALGVNAGAVVLIKLIASP